MATLRRFAVAVVLAFGLALPVFAAPAPHVTISLDATEAPRKICHAHLTIPASPGTLTLYYPKWIPGEHGPTGPIQDLAGLKFTANGQILKWRRDLLDDHPRRRACRRRERGCFVGLPIPRGSRRPLHRRAIGHGQDVRNKLEHYA